MTPQTQITAPRDDDDLAQYARLAHQSFAIDFDDLDVLRVHGTVRLAVSGPRVLGGVTALPVRQFFGGTELPACCLSTVCVAADQRGRGVARRLVEQAVREQRESGAVVSSLWTPSMGVYRRWGWEIAGTTSTYGFPMDFFVRDALRRGALRDFAVTELMDPTEHPLHRRLAADGWNGPVDRPAWWWKWKYPQADPDSQLFALAGADGGTHALVGYTRKNEAPWGHALEVTDYWAADPAAVDLANAFIGSHRSQAVAVRFRHGVLPDPATLLWGSDQYSGSHQHWHPWMLRLLDPRGALVRRSWPEHAFGRLDLRIVHPDTSEEDLLVTVEAGSADVVTGGTGRLRIPVTLLASWYSGALSTDRLLRRSAADDATREDRRLLVAMSAGSRAWLPDLF
ncbi:enhanced intracellular survival protein Eis [Streptomyces sp. NPDC060006]|uniref:GNAT family N-acetyltransferase n=1 Tax=unclassified Streptomyces TaxID=2593676 RepID=UPI0036B91717